MAEITLIKNPAEQQLAAEWAAAKAKLPGAAPRLLVGVQGAVPLEGVDAEESADTSWPGMSPTTWTMPNRFFGLSSNRMSNSLCFPSGPCPPRWRDTPGCESQTLKPMPLTDSQLPSK